MDLVKMPAPVYPTTHNIAKSVGGSTAADIKKPARGQPRDLVPLKIAEKAAELKKLRAQKRRNAVACASIAAWCAPRAACVPGPQVRMCSLSRGAQLQRVTRRHRTRPREVQGRLWECGSV